MTRVATSAVFPWLFVAASAASAAPVFAEERDEKYAVVGLAGVYAPAYPGADDYRSLPFPVLDLKYGRFFANAREGLGATVLEGQTVSVDAGVTFMQGYRRRDVPDGVGRLSGGAGARIAAKARLGRFVAGVGATRALTGEVDGTLIDANLAMPIHATRRLTLIPSVSATWADGAYNRSYFGIDARQAAASGLSLYRPGSGLNDISASLTASYRLNDRVTLGATGAVSSLRGDAKKSPIVFDATQPVAFISMSYRF